MNLLLVEPSEVSERQVILLRDRRARHLLDVLGVTEGRTVRAGIVEGPIGSARVERVGAGEVELSFSPERMPDPPAVDLVLALPRPKVMKRLWSQISAMGVHRLWITNAERVERNYFDSHVLRESIYRPLLVEGLEQAGDTRLPTVSLHRQFRKLVETEMPDPGRDEIRLVAHPGAGPGIVSTVRPADARRVVLAVGPEGGWNDFERATLAGRGFVTVGMGSRTLRSDTACIALLALAHEALRAPKEP